MKQNEVKKMIMGVLYYSLSWYLTCPGCFSLTSLYRLVAITL